MTILFSHLVVLLLFLTFDSSILTLYNFNITCDRFFLKFGGSLTFFSHLTVLSSHFAIPTSHVTILFAKLVVPLLFFLTFDGFILILCSSNITCDSSCLTFSDSLTFFSHLTVPSSHYANSTSHVIIFFPHIGGSLTFFLKFDNFILILCGSNITYDSFFVTLGGSLTFFTHLTVPSSYCAIPTSHVTVLFSKHLYYNQYMH